MTATGVDAGFTLVGGGRQQVFLDTRTNVGMMMSGQGGGGGGDVFETTRTYMKKREAKCAPCCLPCHGIRKCDQTCKDMISSLGLPEGSGPSAVSLAKVAMSDIPVFNADLA